MSDMFKLFKKQTGTSLEITVSNRTVVRILAIIIAAFILLAAIRTARHAFILIFVAVFLAAVALVACCIPAVRAAAIEPQTALRHE